MKYLLILIFLISCGKLKVEVEDSEHTGTVSGEILNRMIIELSFIGQINQLCTDLYPQSEFETIDQRKKQIAQCTLDHISVLNIDGLTVDNFAQYVDEICQDPRYSDEEICQ